MTFYLDNRIPRGYWLVQDGVIGGHLKLGNLIIDIPYADVNICKSMSSHRVACHYSNDPLKIGVLPVDGWLQKQFSAFGIHPVLLRSSLPNYVVRYFRWTAFVLVSGIQFEEGLVEISLRVFCDVLWYVVIGVLEWWPIPVKSLDFDKYRGHFGVNSIGGCHIQVVEGFQWKLSRVFDIEKTWNKQSLVSWLNIIE